MPRPTLANTIADFLREQEGLRADGIFEMAYAMGHEPFSVRRSIQRMASTGQVHYHPCAGGRGHKSFVRLLESDL